MSLGEKILELRKKKGLSQEQLGEKIGVTRQTISNWELDETMPNPDQLKLLSRELKVSIDELLDNGVFENLVEKVSNTEKLAGIIIKILKFIGIAFIVFFVIDIVALVLFISNGKMTTFESSTSTVCKIDDAQYEIEFGTDNHYKCENCSVEMRNEIKSLVDFDNIEDSMMKVQEYFKARNGICE